MPGVPRICACLIVKDEAAVIGRCLESIRPHVQRWAIVDTGSTDKTPALVHEAMAGIPGKLYHREWVDFSTNRNQALDAAREMGADYALLIDADEVLVADESAAFTDLGDPAYAMPLVMGEQRWFRLTLVRLDLPWRYTGAIHETITCEDQHGPFQVLDEFQIENYADGASSEDDIAKCEKYAELLRRELAADPDSTRHLYYLAQATAGAQRIDEAIELYEKRAAIDAGFQEERFHALFESAKLREFRGDPVGDVIDAYQRAYEVRPTRAEPLWAIAVLHQDRGQHAIAEVYARAACRLKKPTDSLPVYGSVYHFRAVEELAGALGEVDRPGALDEAIKIYEQVASHESIPETERPRMRENLAYLRNKAAAREQTEPMAAE